MTFTPISEVGEFGLIDRLKAVLGPPIDDDVVLSIGDDAAVVNAGEGRVQLITTDALIEGVHFDRTFMPLEHLGFKAIAVNVSDIVAMNGRPRFATVALGLPNNMSVEMTEAVYRGMKRACQAYGVTLLGGDTTAARVTMLSVTVIGEALEPHVRTRSGARPGDLLCVTGDVGSAYAGLKLLLDQKAAFEREGEGFQPDLSAFDYVVERQLMPQARLDVVRAWSQRALFPSALIDVSDGLSSEIHHLCTHSGCGARVQASRLPVHRQTFEIAQRFGDDPATYAFFGGEDYELLFALPAADLDEHDPGLFTPIGTFTSPEEGIHIETPDGQLLPLEPRGFNHF